MPCAPVQAEKEGLVRVKIGLDDPEQHLLSSIIELYCSGGPALLTYHFFCYVLA